MQLFFHPGLTDENKDLIFDRDESRHIQKVLRKREGDELMITNGDGLLAYVRITALTPNSCRAALSRIEQQSPLPYRLHLAVAPTKSNDRFEWFIEKATEIGITEITPVICAHSERKMVKLERLERVAVAAMKQSLGCWLPTINKAVNFNDFIKTQQTADFKGIAHCTETEKQSLGKLLQSGQDCLLLIGPEGDFSDQEIDQAIDHGYQPVSLGTKRLRTETAAIVACHSVAFINYNL